MFDYHMHSNFSADSSTPMEKMIEFAINHSIKEICFTEHIDYDYPDPTISFELDLEGYDQKIKEVQAKYQDQITIRKGVEIGVEPCLLDRYQRLMDKETFDFVICSMHTSDRKELHTGRFFENRTAEEAYQIYYEELLYCVKHFKSFSILGHLDLVKRYKKLDSDRNFHEIIREIFRVIIPDGKGIEVNASGFAYGLGGGMPSRDILELYKDCGGEIITTGSDAHEAHHLAHRFPEILQLLDTIGFKYVATFEKLQPTLHPIKELL